MLETYSRLAQRALRDEPPSEAEAQWMLDGEDVQLLALLSAAYAPREAAFADFCDWFDSTLGPMIAIQPWSVPK